jgi:hypothetical protein
MDKWEELKKRLIKRRNSFKKGKDLTAASWPYQWVLIQMEDIEKKKDPAY